MAVVTVTIWIASVKPTEESFNTEKSTEKNYSNKHGFPDIPLEKGLILVF